MTRRLITTADVLAGNAGIMDPPLTLNAAMNTADLLVMALVAVRPAKGEPPTQEWFDTANNALAFITANVTPEVAVYFTRQAVAVHRLPFHMRLMPAYAELAERYRHLVMA
jgi:hypothetical protein